MNRRDAFKMAAAAAAGSLVGRQSGDPCIDIRDNVLWCFRCDYKGPDLGHRCPDLTPAIRLQQAIELGDKTAEELGFRFLITRGVEVYPEADSDEPLWQGLFCDEERYTTGVAQDPDPLTAVQKAREATLKWKQVRDAIDIDPDEWTGLQPRYSKS